MTRVEMGQRGSFEVWGVAAWAALDMGARGGLPTEAILEGLPFDAVSLRKQRRIDWVDYCTIVERIELLAGGPEQCERLLASEYHESMPPVRAIARSFVSPKAFLRFVIEVVDVIMLP